MSENVTSPQIIQLPLGKKIKILKIGPTSKPSLTTDTAKMSLPMPMVSKLPPLTVLKGIDRLQYNLHTDKLPEVVLKRQLIKDFGDCGVTFNNSMLAGINKFFNGVKSLFIDKISMLEATNKDLHADLNKLRNELSEQTEASTANKKLVQASEYEQLPQVLQLIRTLSTRFLNDLEIAFSTVNRSSSEENLSKENVQDPSKENVKVEDIQSIEQLTKELAARLPGTEEEQILRCKHHLEKIMTFLFNREELQPTTVDVNSIEQLPMVNEAIENQKHLYADVNMGCSIEMPVLQQQAQNNSCVLLREFLPYLKNCINSINEEGDRPIHRDVMANNLSEVKKQCIVLRLLRKTVDIKNDNDYTPLHLAVMHDASTNVIQHLLSSGASYDLRDGDGNTLLHLATESSSLSTLLDDSISNMIGGVKTWECIIDVRNDEGYTALHLAAMQNKNEELQQLISLNPQLDGRDSKSGRTALHFAVEANNVTAVKLLLKCNANPHVQTYGGGSIIQALSELDSGFPSAIKKLFYNDLMKIKSTVEPPGQKSSKRNRLKASFSDGDNKRNKCK